MFGRRFRFAIAIVLAYSSTFQDRVAYSQVPGGLISTPTAAASQPYQTFWKFFGVRQEYRRLYDGLVNRNGNHPLLERKPPLKAISDPENLVSKNPAIKRAAEVKFEEDLAMQKVKAIKYLSKIGCGCYPGVKEALMAALDDCTEFVRYEACKAIAEAAVSKCATCNKSCCCDEELSKKLAKMAWEKDDEGCCFERSARVREAAREAVNACCCAKHGYGDPQPPNPTENPVEKPNQPREVIPTPKALPRETVPDAPPKAPEQSPKNTTNTSPNPAVVKPLAALPPVRKMLSNPPEQSFGSSSQPNKNSQVRWASDEEKSQIRQATATLERIQPTTPTSKKKSELIPAGMHANIASSTATAESKVATTPIRPVPSNPDAPKPKSKQAEDAHLIVTISDQPGKAFGANVRAVSMIDSRHTAAGSADQSSQPESFTRVCGQVLAVNNECGIVTAEFCCFPRPQANEIAKVYHDYLLSSECSGAFSIVSVQNSIVTMRPMGDGLLGKVSLGDCVVCDTRSPQPRAPQKPLPAVKKEMDTPPLPPRISESKHKGNIPNVLPPSAPLKASQPNNNRMSATEKPRIGWVASP